MNRFIVALLAAVDAVIAVAVGIAAVLAPLTLLWVFALGGTADWSALWPGAAAVWQLGNLVPLAVTLPDEYLAVTGITADAASFTLSLAPLAFATFTAIFGARSGVRASRAGAWITGVATGSVVFAALTATVALTSRNPVAETEMWQAILLPSLVYALPALTAAVVTQWCDADAGAIARLRARVEVTHRWGAVPGLVARGTAIAVAGLIGAGALLVAVMLVLRGAEVIALYQTANVDALGATVLTLSQLAYTPTLAVWGMSFLAGPGFALGTGTAVSPAGTQLGVLPGVPVLGIVPESTTSWLLLLALVPIALGAFAGWIARSRLVAVPRRGDDAVLPRLVIAVGIAVLSGAAAALLAVVANGSIGPGRLADIGPQPGPIALTVGLEVLVGAGILLLSPWRRRATQDVSDSPASVVERTSIRRSAVTR